MKTGYLVFLGLYFLGLMIRAIYEQLKKAGRVNPKNMAILAIVFFAMCLMWASWFNMCSLDPLQFSLPRIVRWFGFGAFLVGLGFSIGAVIQLRGLENINHLVTKGLFSKIRHPMYVGFILWIFGWAIYHGAAISLFVGFVAIVNILYWRTLEERELESNYGEVYLEYRKRTWF
jgi:protein-S-isoprenylcysteine O-methyltransferase Ste14